jgi:hypothetical protein
LRFEVYGAYLPAEGSLRLISGTGTVEAQLEISTAEMTGHGMLAVSGNSVAARYGDLDIAGDVTVRVNLTPLAPDPERRAPAFQLAEARLALNHVALGSTKQADDWQAELTLEDGELSLAPLGLSGNFEARLRDTRPLVAVFSEESVAVDLFSQLLTVKDVAARGWLGVEPPQSLRVLDLDATGHKMELSADLDLSGKSATGLLFAKRGPLEVGVELRPDGREWKFVGARRWFEEKHARLRGTSLAVERMNPSDRRSP